MTRWTMAALLTLSVPLCCCQGKQLLSLLWGGVESHSSLGDSDEGAFSAIHGHGALDMHDDSPPMEHCEDIPCDDGDCDCGNADLLAVLPTVTPVNASFSFSLLHFSFTEVTPLAPSPTLAHAGRVELAFFPRPLTSLLRLHCALQV